MALSGGTLATLRKPLHGVKSLTVCIWPLEADQTADVDGTPDYSAPVAEIDVNNESADWDTVRRGQLVRIHRAGVLIYEGVTRRNLATGKLYIAAIREGDTGTAQEFTRSIADNDVVTTYTASVPASFLSRGVLDEADNLVLYKRYDVEFDTDRPQTQYPEPHPRFGRHRHVEIEPGGTAGLQFVDASYDFKGDTLTRTWGLPTGITLDSGTLNDATINVTADPGNYKLRLTASRTSVVTNTDESNGFRHVFVTDGPGGANPAFSDLFAVTGIERDEQDAVGRSVVLTVTRDRGAADDVLNYLYYGAFVLMQESPAFSADDWTTVDALDGDDGFVDQFVGYIRRYEMVGTDADGIETWQVLVECPLRFFDDLPIPSQSIRANDPPTTWEEASSALMDVGFWLYALLYYHAQELARLHDLYFEDVRGFQSPAVSWTERRIGPALRELIGRCAGANIGCASWGALYARRHPCYETDTYRNVADVVLTWSADDIADGMLYPRDPLKKVSRTSGVGLVSSSSDIGDLVEGEVGYLAPEQGAEVAQLPGFIGADENDILYRIGHHHALQNRPTETINLEVAGNMDVADPALMAWHKLDLSAYAPLGSAIFDTSRRFVPVRVARQWAFTPLGISKHVTVDFQPETKGPKAVLVPAPEIDETVIYVPPGAEIDVPVPPGSAYDWCRLFDFTVDSEGWSSSGVGGGTYSAGVGWVKGPRGIGLNTYYEVYFKHAWGLGGSYNLQKVTVVYDLTPASSNPYEAFLLYDRVTGSGGLITSVAGLTAGTGSTAVWTGGTHIYDGIKVRLLMAINDSSGSLTITSIRLEGSGTPPPFSAGNGSDCT